MAEVGTEQQSGVEFDAAGGAGPEELDSREERAGGAEGGGDSVGGGELSAAEASGAGVFGDGAAGTGGGGGAEGRRAYADGWGGVKGGVGLTDTHDYLLDDFELRILTAKGAPLRGVEIGWEERRNLCGGWQPGGQTDARGIARIQLIPEIIESFTLMQSNGQAAVTGGEFEALKSKGMVRDLTDSELRTLFSRHKLTIRW